MGAPSEQANLVWASALAGDGRGERLLGRLAEAEPGRSPSGELGQVLYGLVVGADAFAAKRDLAMNAAAKCAAELLRRFRPGADVFRATPQRRTIPRRELIESRFTHFAAQVYPLHGLAAFHLATGAGPAGRGRQGRRAHRRGPGTPGPVVVDLLEPVAQGARGVPGLLGPPGWDGPSLA